jgi:hypothetical protein
MRNVTVTLTPEMAEQYQAYAQAAGITLERAVNRALDKWMEETGRFVYEEMRKRQGSGAKLAPATA